MKKFAVIFLLLSGATLYLIVDLNKEHTKWLALQEMTESSVQQVEFKYQEADPSDFYSSAELVGFLEEELPEQETQEELDNSYALIKAICPDVELSGNSIVVQQIPASSPTVVTVQSTAKDTSEITNRLITVAESCLGVPYTWGGNTKESGMDCSGFVKYVYNELGFTLPRHSSDQSKVGKLIKRTELKVGDLLFFDTKDYRSYADVLTPEEEMAYAKAFEEGYAPDIISHVGIYMGNGMMIHAPTFGQTIQYTSLETDYYKTRFVNARRLIKDE